MHGPINVKFQGVLLQKTLFRTSKCILGNEIFRIIYNIPTGVFSVETVLGKKTIILFL